MKQILSGAALAALLAVSLPVAAQAQSSGGTAAGAVGGAAAGAAVGGPVGAAVGGITGAVVGGALGPQDTTRVKEYVVREHHPSVRVKENVVVGADLPNTVELYPLPADTGVRTEYRYTVVNDHTVLVDPKTRKVIQIIQ